MVKNIRVEDVKSIKYGAINHNDVGRIYTFKKVYDRVKIEPEPEPEPEKLYKRIDDRTKWQIFWGVEKDLKSIEINPPPRTKTREDKYIIEPIEYEYTINGKFINGVNIVLKSILSDFDPYIYGFEGFGECKVYNGSYTIDNNISIKELSTIEECFDCGGVKESITEFVLLSTVEITTKDGCVETIKFDTLDEYYEYSDILNSNMKVNKNFIDVSDNRCDVETFETFIEESK